MRKTVPLAIKSELTMSMGLVGSLPIRAVLAVIVMAIPALMVVLMPVGPLEFRFGVALVLILGGLGASYPKVDGIWYGFQLLYRHLPLTNSISIAGSQRVRATWKGDMLEQSAGSPVKSLPIWRGAMEIPHVVTRPHSPDFEAGLIELKPGGWRGILEVKGPATALYSESFDMWGEQLLAFIGALDVPAQIVTVVDHYNATTAQRYFDQAIQRPILAQNHIYEGERELVGVLAETSIRLRTFLVLAPGTGHADGMPVGASLLELGMPPSPPREVVQESMNQALRLAGSFGIKVKHVHPKTLVDFLQDTVVGCQTAVATERVVRTGQNLYHLPLTITKLPRQIEAGSVLESIIGVHQTGFVSLHLYPVTERHAQKLVVREAKMHNTVAANKSGFEVSDDMMIADAQILLQQLAQGERLVRTALTIDLTGASVMEVEAAAEQLATTLEAKGFEVVHPRQPGLMPVLAAAPGGLPLKRSLHLTTRPIAAALVPALGTALNRPSEPLLGINAFTASPAYWSCWSSKSNNNALIFATSGAGKSMTMKTLLYRHWLQGSNFVVLDPDNEYEHIVLAAGGEYHRIGDGDALNPFSVVAGQSPEEGAALVAPLLSVLAADMARDSQGRAIRYLEPGDASWLQTQTMVWLRNLNSVGMSPELAPRLSGFVDWLSDYAGRRAVSDQDAERARRIVDRLRFYTMGKAGQIFDHPSTFAIGDSPVGIGLRELTADYGADLTPVMSLILTALMHTLLTTRQRLIVAIDEASAFTQSPDAGHVLQQLIRRSRKLTTGVWMASQMLEDFLGTDLGNVLMKNSATTFVMKLKNDQAHLAAVRETFGLTEDEGYFVMPGERGSGLLLQDDGTKVAVHIVPSDLLLALGHTGAVEDEYDDTEEWDELEAA